MPCRDGRHLFIGSFGRPAYGTPRDEVAGLPGKRADAVKHLRSVYAADPGFMDVASELGRLTNASRKDSQLGSRYSYHADNNNPAQGK
jgi:hypothetical protein